MSMISIPVPQETEKQIRQMFEGIAREVIQHAAENEMNSKDFMNYKETAAYCCSSINLMVQTSLYLMLNLVYFRFFFTIVDAGSSRYLMGFFSILRRIQGYGQYTSLIGSRQGTTARCLAALTALMAGV